MCSVWHLSAVAASPPAVPANAAAAFGATVGAAFANAPAAVAAAFANATATLGAAFGAFDGRGRASLQ